MERLLVLRLESVGVVAEAWLNGVPLARTAPPPGGQRPQAVMPGSGSGHAEGAVAAAGLPDSVLTVPVHEYTLAGANALQLLVHPPPPAAAAGAAAVPEPRLSDGRSGASLRLLLPRVGQRAHPEYARTLAQIDWAPPAGEVYTAPLAVSRTVDLPIAWPRWRFLDAPVIAEPQAQLTAAVACLQTVALGLMRGDAEPLIQLTRLRLEDLAQAYQRNLVDEVGRLRLAIQRAHAVQPLKPAMPTAENLRLRPVAGSRLLECLAPDGSPALSSAAAGGGRMAWPLRLALIDDRLYGLR